MNLFSKNRFSLPFLTYGIFASLCHATGVLLGAHLSGIECGGVLFHRYFPMLEYSLMSFVLTLSGALLIEYVISTTKEP